MHVRDSRGAFQPVNWYVGNIVQQGTQDAPLLRLNVQSRGLCDFGSAFYAVQSFEDERGRRIAVGWLVDWYGQRRKSTSASNGTMTFPRELHIVDGTLRSYPVQEIFDYAVKDKLSTADADSPYYARIELDADSKEVKSDFDVILAEKAMHRFIWNVEMELLVYLFVAQEWTHCSIPLMLIPCTQWRYLWMERFLKSLLIRVKMQVVLSLTLQDSWLSL